MIKRALFIGLMWLCFAMGAFAQSTVVSGTIADSSSQVWFGGSVQITFYPSPTNPSGPYFWQGAAFNTQQVFKAALNSSGAFSGLSIPSNNFITPSGSLWSVQVCPAASSNCYTTNVSLTQPTQNISSLVVPPPIKVNAAGVSQLSAYQDSEIVNPSLGTTYFNLTLNAVRACTVQLPCTWVTIGTGGGSGVASFTGDGAFSCNTASTGSVIFDLCPTPVLPNGTTATTQTTGDNSTKVATDAFVIANAGGGGGSPAGSDTDVQINKAGVFGASSFLAVDNSTTPTTLNVGGNVVTKGPNPQIDVQAFGARPLAVNPTTTCSTTGSGPPYTQLNCASAAGLIKNDGFSVDHAGAATTQTTPAAPTVTSPVIHGSGSYSYECVGVDVGDGLTAASASTTIADSPNVFGNLPVNISGVSWSGGSVTITTATTFDANFSSYAANTKHANIVGLTAGYATLNSFAVLIASEPSATSFTFAFTGSGTGTFTGATARATNTFVGVSGSRVGQTIFLNTDIASGIQVGSATNPTVVIATGWLPADMNGYYILASDDGDNVAGTDISINRQALNENETATQAGFVTVYEKNIVACPNITAPTDKYAVYGTSNPGGTMQFLGFTEYNQRTFTDWGYWIRNGSSGVYDPPWLPSTPPSAAQAQVGQTVITNISGNTLTINPGVATAVTSAVSQHDDGYPIFLAGASVPHNQSNAIDLVLSPPLVGCSTPCPYHIESPAGLDQGENLVVENMVNGDDTFYGAFNGLTIKKGEKAVAQYAGETFASQYYEPWIGHGNPLIAFTSGQNTIQGIYFGTTEGGVTNDDGQELVHIDGSSRAPGGEAEYGFLRDDYFSTGNATTSEGIVCVWQCDYIQIINPTFNSTIPWRLNTSGTINWGPTIGAVEMKCDDNSGGYLPGEIYFSGTVQFSGKGVLFNQVSCSSLGSNFAIGTPGGGVDDQQPVTPLAMVLGGPGGPNNLSIYHSTMDSVSIPMVFNGGRPSFWTLDSVSVSSGVPLISGSYIGNLTVKDPSYPAGALGQNIFLSLVTPINPTGVQGGLITSLLEIEGCASGSYALADGTGCGFPTSGNIYYVVPSTAGADLGAKIQTVRAVANAASPLGAIIDITAFTGTQTVANSFWGGTLPSSASYVESIRTPCNLNVQTSVAMVMPTHYSMSNDCGWALATPYPFGGFSLQAANSFPTSTPILELGVTGTASFGAYLHGSYRVTCVDPAGTAIASCITVQNTWCQQGCGWDNLVSDGGLVDIHGSQAQNSGPFRNTIIGMNGLASAGAKGMQVGDASALLIGKILFDHITCDGVADTTEPTTCMTIDAASITVHSFDGEHCVNCLVVGSARNTHGVKIEAYGCAGTSSYPVTDCVQWSNSFAVDGSVMEAGYTLAGTNVTNLFHDEQTPACTIPTATVAELALYARDGGNITSTQPNLCPSATTGTVVASLPAAASYPGTSMYVTDSTAIASEGQTCVGSSSTKAVAVSNGSVWKCF
jgi:hypothetical protein